MASKPAKSQKTNASLSIGTALRRKEINVLLITADPDDARAVEAVLASEPDGLFRVQWLSHLSEGLQRLCGKMDVVLLDLRLPDVSGIGALDSLLAAAPHIPILVVGGKDDEDLARQAVQQGAQDYLLKNHLDSYSLPRALCNVIDRKTAEEALFLERERAQVTLDSIGDAVLSTDSAGNVTYLNSVAEKMTGWSREDARGRPVGEVLRIVDSATREPSVHNPMVLAMQQNKAVGLAANSVLIQRDGFECAIEDTAAPIHSRDGGVIGAVMVFHDVSESRAVASKMAHLAQHDFLTDLPNPVLLNDRITQAIARALRYDKQLAVLFIDLDHFKHINDSLGHATGDKLLQSVALRLKGCVRNSDAVGRRGGDEFVVLLSEITHAEHAARIAGKIITAVTAAHQVAGHELLVTASIGISLYPLDGADAETLLKSADAAMYQAKKNGRNHYCFFKQEMNLSSVAPGSVPNLVCPA
ncbi:MAG: diguanylate cyclase [Betaproteobacteria bacterium]|nr:diguanylate cyclase [Betaproteobacteria bacterium]